MADFSGKLLELRRILKLHANWLLYATIGESALTESELAALRTYGKLPMYAPLDLISKSYFSGRMRATKKTSEFKDATKIESAILTPAEESALEGAKHKSILRLENVANAALGSPTGAKAWSKAAKTEFQIAKIQGIANTIANKSDLYGASAGPDSDVSVIPAKNCCEDCRFNYVGPDGNPRVFKLADLMNAGSNADAGTIHTRTGGLHAKWKTTLPPLHPSCGCLLMYVPPGHGWVGGKLSLLNKSLFLEHISKANGSRMEATVKPTGAPSLNEEPGAASLPGAAAPGNVAGPGRPPGLPPKPGSGSGGPGGGPVFQACPWQKCPIGHHKPGSAVYMEHAQYAKSAGEMTPAAEEQEQKALSAASSKFDAQPHPRQVIADSLKNGKIGAAKKLGEEEGAGISTSYKVSLVGGGNACAKPPMKFSDLMYHGMAFADGGPSIPKNSAHKNEASASDFSTMLGMEHVPVTTVRQHDGGDGIDHKGPLSMQQWQDDYRALPSHAPSYNALLDAVPEAHREAMHQKLSEIACMDIAMNNNDRHTGNLVFSKDMTDVKAIDNSLSFAAGMAGHKNMLHSRMTQAGKPLKMPDHMLERVKNQSLDSTVRSLPNLEPWQAAQAHVRMKYLAHLQETHGHIPIEVTRYATVTAAAEGMSHDLIRDQYGSAYRVPKSAGWANGHDERLDEANAAHDRWEMPDQLYARFAKAYVDGKVGSGSASDRSTLRMFRPAFPTGSGHAAKGAGFEHGSFAADQHQEYWKSIPEWDGGMSSWPKDGAEASPTRVAPEMPKTEKPVDVTPDPGTVKQRKVKPKVSTFENAPTERASVEKSLYLARPKSKFSLT